METGRSATGSPSPHWRAVRSQCSRTHTESRCQRWWDIAQRISATRTAPFMRRSRCGICAQPMTSRFAHLVDALNRESRQILHHSPRNCVALEPVRRVSITNSGLTELTKKIFFECRNCALGAIRCQQKSTTRYSSSVPIVENGFSLPSTDVLRLRIGLRVLARRVEPRLDSCFDPRVPAQSLAWREPAFSSATLPSPPAASSGGLSPVAYR